MMSKCALFVLAASAASLLPAQTVDQAFYESTIRPILRNNCFACHTDKNLTSGLSVETQESLLRGGNRGAAVNKDKPAESTLLQAIRHAEGAPKMPPGKKLSGEQAEAIERWIAAGIPMPAELVKTKRKGADHWAFQPVKRPELPATSNAAWARNAIDHFILARLDAAKLKPSPEAAKETLLRRVHLDLTGLLPTPAELTAFLNDKRGDAYEQVVDKLLMSPHYGERWGRHWLDMARYADSDGYTIDAPRNIWMYRDWVIKALNDDMPFDRFTIEQFAGDMLANAGTSQLVATGFHRNTPSNFEGGIDFEQYRVEAVADRVATTGAVYLGLTLGCARCHDHKYDPVSQREFYQLFSFLNNVDEVDKEDDRKYFNRPFLELPTPEESARRSAHMAQLKALEGELEAYKKGLPKNASTEVEPGLKEREANLLNLQNRLPKIEQSTMVMRERATPRQAYIHLGGDFTRHGANVNPGVLGALNPFPAGTALTREGLARWLVDKANPLTPRVTMNRMWQRYFGAGIVGTENDFGTQGDKPTHPELLDWLAAEFMDRGWSQKAMHRLIVTSSAYRQASGARSDAAAVDPDNKLLARQNRIRLDAEVIRDVSLSAAGVFHPAVGGPSVYPPQPAGVYQVTQVRREWKTSTGGDRYRRGMYTFFQRSAPHPSLILFDAPDATVACTRRTRSNTPLQALTQLNDETTTELSEALSRRMIKEAPAADGPSRLRQGYLMSVNRMPRTDEEQRLLRFFDVQRDSVQGKPEAKEQRAWSAVARVLLNLDEFLTRE